jgi:hypothetical protein
MMNQGIRESGNQEIGGSGGQGIGELGDQEVRESGNQPAFQPSSLPAFQSSNLPVFQSSSLSAPGRWLLLVGLLPAAVGASFGPWVDRPAAALMLTAPDLAEFVKFLPEVRTGSLTIHRLLFLFPLFVTTFALPLVVTNRGLGYPGWVRWPALVAVMPLSLTLLPPVWSPGVLLSAEFRLQTSACALCLGMVVAARWLRLMPLRPLVALLVPLSLAAPALALWQFFAVQEAVAHAYASPIFLGWGAWIAVVGFALAVFGMLLTLRGLSAPSRLNA